MNKNLVAGIAQLRNIVIRLLTGQQNIPTIPNRVGRNFLRKVYSEFIFHTVSYSIDVDGSFWG
jgi:hypothetical protein